LLFSHSGATLPDMAGPAQTEFSAAPTLPRERIKLTDRFVAGCPKAPEGKRTEFLDSLVPGLAVRVTDRGHRSFILRARFPANPSTFTRRQLGNYPAMRLEEARTKARAWQLLIDRGVDPAHEEERQRLARARQAETTVSAVFEEFVTEKLAHERKGDEVANDMRRDFLPRLGARPIAQVERIEIREIIKAKKKTAPAQARNLLGYIKRFFSWALDQEVYGLKASPCSDIRPVEIIGRRRRGDRVLTDDELFALWRAAGRESYPYQQVYQVLMLNALRLNEAADAESTEFEFAKRDWTVPGERMKGRNSEARPHLVPLTAWTLEIIGTLPQLSEGPFLFSCNFGKSAAWIGSKVKDRLDARMLRTLRALARKAGRDARQVELKAWTNHDIRRTVRTRLSGLRTATGGRIPDEVKESVIAHVRPGIKGVYDLYEYSDEKFEALELWHKRLAEIVGVPT
jgi:hypothetical protein